MPPAGNSGLAQSQGITDSRCRREAEGHRASRTSLRVPVGEPTHMRVSLCVCAHLCVCVCVFLSLFSPSSSPPLSSYLLPFPVSPPVSLPSSSPFSSSSFFSSPSFSLCASSLPSFSPFFFPSLPPSPLSLFSFFLSHSASCDPTEAMERDGQGILLQDATFSGCNQHCSLDRTSSPCWTHGLFTSKEAPPNTETGGATLKNAVR